MANFASVLSRRVEEIEAPVPIPVGRYIGVVTEVPKVEEIGQNKTLGARLKIKLLQPLDDVDQSALAAAGGLPERPLNHVVYLTEDSEYRAKVFFTEHLGIETDATTTLGELIDKAQGQQVGVTIEHRPSKDGQMVYAQVKDTFNPNA